MKINNLYKGFALLGIFTIWSCESDDTQTVTTMDNLIWEEEFDGTDLDTSKWNLEIGNGANGWGNNELQYYTDRAENIKLEDGMLIITAQEEAYEGFGFTSARINTKDKFEQQYGRFEAKIKLPWGQGLWPAFWLLGADIDENSWPQCGEIDIMEYTGQQPSIIHGSVHGPGYSGALAETKTFQLPSDRFDTDFHIFGIEWGPNYINYYVDDILYNQITPEDVNGEWVFNKPFFVIMNLAVGGNFVGAPNAETEFPQKMYVDYIKVYN